MCAFPSKGYIIVGGLIKERVKTFSVLKSIIFDNVPVAPDVIDASERVGGEMGDCLSLVTYLCQKCFAKCPHMPRPQRELKPNYDSAKNIDHRRSRRKAIFGIVAFCHHY